MVFVQRRSELPISCTQTPVRFTGQRKLCEKTRALVGSAEDTELIANLYNSLFVLHPIKGEPRTARQKEVWLLDYPVTKTQGR